MDTDVRGQREEVTSCLCARILPDKLSQSAYVWAMEWGGPPLHREEVPP